MNIHYFRRTIALLLLVTTASPAWATPEGRDIARPSGETRAVQLQDRLEEIKSLDKRDLSRGEKKALRREVREIKKELAAISGGVYLSVGALLLIALLLILLL